MSFLFIQCVVLLATSLWLVSGALLDETVAHASKRALINQISKPVSKPVHSPIKSLRIMKPASKPLHRTTAKPESSKISFEQCKQI